MNRLPFTLRQLDVFEHVCETRSFRKASEELGISQASVSNQLKALEMQLGVRLLTRDRGKRPQLTSDGASFFADLGRFREAAAVLASHSHVVPAEANRVRVRLHGMIGTYVFINYVRPKLEGFSETHPDIELDIVSPIMLEGHQFVMAREEFDFAIYQDDTTGPLGSGYRKLAPSPCGVYGHPKFLQGQATPLSAERINEFPFLLPSAGTYFEGVFLYKLAKHGIRPKTIVGRSGFFDVMADMIENGESVLTTLESMLIHVKERKSVLLYPLEDWRVVFYRNPEKRIPEMDIVEEFLVSAVLDDPGFPRAKPHALAG